MNDTIMFTICSFFYCIILIFKVFGNKKYKSERIFKWMVIVGFFEIVSEILCWGSANLYGVSSIITHIFTRIFLCSLTLWVPILTKYICEISLKNDSKLKIKLNYLIDICTIVSVILVIIFPLSYSAKPIYAYGLATKPIYYFSEFYVVLSFIVMIKGNTSIDYKKYSPLFIYLVSGVILMIVQSIRPDWLLANFVDTYINFLVFLNIESNYNNQNNLDNKENK